MANNLKGCSPVCATFSLTEAQNPAYTYNWLFSPNFVTGNPTLSTQYNPQRCFTEAGSYNVGVTVISPQGCSSQITYTNLIQVSDKPEADFSFSPNPVSMLEPLIHFTNLSSGASLYYWDFGDQTSSSIQVNPNYTYNHAGNYLITLIAKGSNACTDTVYKQLIIEEEFSIYIPNAFTPNSDKVNDTWGPEGVGISDKDYSLMVFDRWGEKIFEGKALNDRWDGIYNGSAVKNDVYVYKLSCKAGNNSKVKVYTGHVMVNR